MKVRDYEYAPTEREKDGPYGRDASAFVSCFRSRANPNLCCSLVDHARAFRGWAEASTVDVALVDVVKVDVAASSLRSPDSRFAIRASTKKTPSRLTPKSPPPPSPLWLRYRV